VHLPKARPLVVARRLRIASQSLAESTMSP